MTDRVPCGTSVTAAYYRILFKMLVLGINDIVIYLSSEVLKGYSLFLIYKTNIFFLNY